jgi:hypothetical protein
VVPLCAGECRGLSLPLGPAAAIIAVIVISLIPARHGMRQRSAALALQEPGSVPLVGACTTGGNLSSLSACCRRDGDAMLVSRNCLPLPGICGMQLLLRHRRTVRAFVSELHDCDLKNFRCRFGRQWLLPGSAHVASSPMQGGSLVRRFMVLAAGGIVVSGVALAVGALGASALFGRGKPEVVLFAAGTAAVAAITYGCVISSAVTRLSNGEHPAAQAPAAYSSTLAMTHGSGSSDVGLQR